MSELSPTPRTRLRRHAERGSYERETIHAILDEGFICHVATGDGGAPQLIPTAYARVGDSLYLHGSSGNRVLATACDGAELALCVTLVDGLVLARSAFRHSINYRCVVVYGRAFEVTDPDEKLDALRATVDHLIPGRSDDVRGPDADELRQTRVVKLRLDEASAKLRSGPPLDGEADLGLDCWAGVIPLAQTAGPLVDDPRLAAGVAPPAYARGWRRP